MSYVFSSGDSFPLPINVSSEKGFINYTIVDGSNPGTIFNLTAVMIVDLYVLFQMGYRRLDCGSSTRVTDTFIFNDLDIEGR